MLPEAQWLAVPLPRLLGAAAVTVLLPARDGDDAGPQNVDLREVRRLLTVRRAALIECGAYLMARHPALRYLLGAAAPDPAARRGTP